MTTVPSTPRSPGPPDTAARLLEALEAAGPNPALAWYGEAARIELSGHVLANWVIKAIGHLHDEIALQPGDQVVLDLPPHWKRLVLALAAWSLGAEVTMLDRPLEAADGPDGPASADEPDGSAPADGPAGAAPPAVVPSAPQVVATDRPGSPLAEGADEVLALQAVSLAPRFDGELPPLAHDWPTEVRGSSDHLGVALPAWSGPAPRTSPDGRPRLLVPADGVGEAPAVLGALLAGGGLVGPAHAVTPRQALEEAVTGRA